MIRKWTILTITVWGLLFSVCTSSCTPEKPSELLLINYLLARHLTTNTDSMQISHCLDTLLRGIEYQSKFSINQPYNAGKLNIYLFNGESEKVNTDDHFKNIRSNCSYVGSNVMMIDEGYLHSFLHKHHVETTHESIFHLTHQTCFTYWILGHELVHFFKGQSKSHYDTSYLDNFVTSSDIENKYELEADSFFVNTIATDKMLLVSVETTLLDLLNAEMQQKNGVIETQGAGIIYDYTNSKVVEYSRQLTHPEFVVRLGRMLELSTLKSDESGLHLVVMGFTAQLKESKRK